MLHLTYTLNFVLMLALPIALGFFVVRRLGTHWSLLLWGAATFIVSQLVRLPLLAGLTALFQSGALPHILEGYTAAFNIAVLSLSAGVFEEGARYLGYRFVVKDAREWRHAVTYGAGHGGFEAIILGALVGVTIVNMIVLQSVDLTTLPIPAEQRAAIAQQLADFWSAPWYLTLLGAVERVFALTTHIALSVMVLQVFARRQIGWLFAAMGWHGLANVVGVSVQQIAGPLAAEGALAVIASAGLWLIFRLRTEPVPIAEARP
ncbi:MAG: YhfC family intramembrane metalloprotease [Anaerolineales bacterium]